MPLSDQCGLIARFSQYLGQGGLASIKAIPVLSKPVDMAVFPRQYYRPTGPTYGIGDIAMCKKGTAFSDPINIGRRGHRSDGVLIGTDRLNGMVIRHNKKNIRPFLGNRALLLLPFTGKTEHYGQ